MLKIGIFFPWTRTHKSLFIPFSLGKDRRSEQWSKASSTKTIKGVQRHDPS
jgi:hypothetical protein